jgi:Holliday junction DNA helicase RuvA
MIATLSGTVAERIDDVVVLDVAGVGYGLWVTNEDASMLTLGVTTKVYVYEHIREQSHDLFGFSSLDTKKLFEKLLSVNGVGPKMALALLSVGSANEVRLAIAEGNVKYLQAANGVGKKVAERVVVDLKDKVGLLAGSDATSFLSVPSSVNDDAHAALVALGYPAQTASELLAGIDSGLSVEERVSLALKGGKR